MLELQPGFRYSRQFAGVNCAPALAKPSATRCGPPACRNRDKRPKHVNVYALATPAST